MQNVSAYQAGNKLKYGCKDIRPTTYDVGDYVANGIADFFAAAITAKDAAEKVANTANDAADGVANGMNDGVAKIFQDLRDDSDHFLYKAADLNENVLDDGDDNLDQLDNRLKH